MSWKVSGQQTGGSRSLRRYSLVFHVVGQLKHAKILASRGFGGDRGGSLCPDGDMRQCHPRSDTRASECSTWLDACGDES